MATETIAPVTPTPTKETTAPRQSRMLVPAVLVAVHWIGWLAMKLLMPGTIQQVFFLFWSPMILALVVLIWLFAFSRLAWQDRVWAAVLLIGGFIAAEVISHPSMRFGILMYAMPLAITIVVAWYVRVKRHANWLSRAGVGILILPAWGYFTLMRIDGIDGSFQPTFSYRWEETAEQRFLAERNTQQSASESKAAEQSIELVEAGTDWHEFRGSQRDGVVRAVKINPDWAANPPRELWRRRVGPGWSSFCVVGDYAFTQEQRGEDEVVVCFEIKTGREVWAHTDKARFEEVVGGAGPRATPTYVAGKLYTQGASGVLNCLDAATGKAIWTQDIAEDASVKPLPQWGLSSSPLVVQGKVITFAGGKDGKSVLAYDAESSDLCWAAGKGTHSYSSPQLWTSFNTDQVLMISEFGLQSLAPATGSVLWEHDWTIGGFRVIQPIVTESGSLLLGTWMGQGTRELKPSAGSDGKWTVEEGWTSKAIKPYFNDAVLYDGHLYGFDNDIFTCISLADGKRAWKQGRYGAGQVLLIEDSGILLVMSENSGELVLLEATPKEHKELARLKVLEGKTWNHPVLSGNRLLVRNGEEMACFEVKLASDP